MYVLTRVECLANRVVVVKVGFGHSERGEYIDVGAAGVAVQNRATVVLAAF
jgi:hypothetical protein